MGEQDREFLHSTHEALDLAQFEERLKICLLIIERRHGKDFMNDLSYHALAKTAEDAGQPMPKDKEGMMELMDKFIDAPPAPLIPELTEIFPAVKNCKSDEEIIAYALGQNVKIEPEEIQKIREKAVEETAKSLSDDEE